MSEPANIINVTTKIVTRIKLERTQKNLPTKNPIKS